MAVSEADEIVSAVPEKLFPDEIVLFLHGVNVAVDFNYEVFGAAAEIDDVGVDGVLAGEVAAGKLVFSEDIPEFAFGGG